MTDIHTMQITKAPFSVHQRSQTACGPWGRVVEPGDGERERVSERESVCERKCECVCVCVREREIDRERERERERERKRECV